MDDGMPQAPETSMDQDTTHMQPSVFQPVGAGHFIFPVDHQGSPVFVRHWLQNNPSAALGAHNPLLLIHDVTEDSSHYEDTGQFFCEQGYPTYAMDLRGHGSSVRQSRNVVQFSTLVLDVLQIAGWIKHQNQGRAPILICQGVGSLIGLEIQRSHFKFCAGVVMVAPTLVLHHRVVLWKRALINSLGELSPGRKVPLSLMPRLHHFDESARSTASRLVTTFVAVNRPQMTLAFAKSLLQALDQTPSKATSANCPILALIPDSSDVIDVGRTASLLNCLKGAPVETSLLPSQRHNLFTEPHSNRISHYERVDLWLKNNNF